MNARQKSSFDRLYEAILRLQSVEECGRFFSDLCTMNELIAISQRFRVAEMLSEGRNYAEISQASGASSATISRVNRSFLYGSGGYKEIIEKLTSGEME